MTWQLKCSKRVSPTKIEVGEFRFDWSWSPSCIRLSWSLTGQAAATNLLVEVVAKTWVEQVHPGLKIKKLKNVCKAIQPDEIPVSHIAGRFFSHSVVESVRVRHRRDEKKNNSPPPSSSAIQDVNFSLRHRDLWRCMHHEVISTGAGWLYLMVEIVTFRSAPIPPVQHLERSCYIRIYGNTALRIQLAQCTTHFTHGTALST